MCYRCTRRDWKGWPENKQVTPGLNGTGIWVVLGLHYNSSKPGGINRSAMLMHTPGTQVSHMQVQGEPQAGSERAGIKSVLSSAAYPSDPCVAE